MKPIKIKVDYFRLIPLLLGAAGFVVIGIFFFLKSMSFDFRAGIFLLITGVISVLFFGAILISMFPRMLTGKLGLTINDEGIIDHSNGTSVGLIKWKDIKKIDSFSTAGQPFIRVFVKNPKDYSNKNGNSIERFFRRQNERFFKSGIQISATNLNIPHSDLLSIIKEEFAKRSI